MSENRSLLLTLRALLVGAVLASPVAECSLASAAVEVLAPGQVAATSAPANLTVPTDGRLRGPDFAARVTGVAWPASVSIEGIDRVAGAGDRLVVFTLRVSQPQQDVGPLAQGTVATAILDVGNDPFPIDLTSIDEQILGSTGSLGSGVATYAAAVPAHLHGVVLSVSEGGFSQRFDLWTLRRLAPSPAILYRDPNTATVTESAPESAAASIENPADGYRSPADVLLSSATLSYFAPDGSDTTPGNAADAFLVLDLSATSPNLSYGQPGWGHYFANIEPLPADRLTFTASGETAIAATSASQSSSIGNPADDDGLFDALYWFRVPASTTMGTISITPGPLTGVEYTGFVGGDAVPLEITGTTTLSISFPPLVSPSAAQATPPWVGAPSPSTNGTTAAPQQGATTGQGFPLWLALVLLAVLAAGLLLIRRLGGRRRGAADTPAPEVAGLRPFTPPQSIPVPPQGFGSPAAHFAAAAPSSPIAVPIVPPVPAVRSEPSTSAVVAMLRAEEPPPLGTPGELVVRVLGPIEFSGWQPPAQRRQQTEALCVYLALRAERPRGTEELLSSLRSPEDPRGEGSPKTLRNTLSLLRQAVGPDRLPDAASSGGYQLRRVVTDRDRFQDLARGGRAEGGDGGDLLLAEALAHVRGAPFAGASPTHYAWAFDGPDASDMTVAIVEVAHELATRRLDVGDLEGATLTAKTGLRASRSEFVLWGDLFAVARAGGDPSTLRRMLADATRVLGADEAARLGAVAPHLDPSVR